jgi:hypothetical protein
MSDDLIRHWCRRLGMPTTALDRIETQAAEIARLRAELATARREGMEEAAKRCELPCIGDHMNAYGRYFAAAIRAAAPNVVQFDRGAKARAALEGKKDE